MVILLTLFAALVFAVGIYAIVHGVFRYLLRKPIPKGTMPLVAGVAMCSFYLMLEYSWGFNQEARFEDDWVVVDRIGDQIWWQPWTLLFPKPVGQVILDTGGTIVSEQEPRYRVAVVYQNLKIAGSSTMSMVLDCDTGRGSPLQGPAPFGPDGTPLDPQWRDLHPEDPIYPLICN